MTAHRAMRRGSIEMEGERHRRALEELRAKFPGIPNAHAGDAGFFAGTLDGASHFGEAVDSLVQKIRDNEALAQAVAGQVAALQARRARFNDAAQGLREKLRNVLCDCVLSVEERSYHRPGFCLTVPNDRRKPFVTDLDALPPDLVVQVPEIDQDAVAADLRAGTLDPRYLRPGPRRPDMAAIAARVERGEDVPGVEVAWVPQSLQIRN